MRSVVGLLLGLASAHAAVLFAEAPVELPHYEITAKQISDFGMGLRLNLGASFGRWKYVKVGDVLPRSAADLGGLRPSMEMDAHRR